MDNDCDGTIDNDLLLTFYFDAYADGFENQNNTVEGCSPDFGLTQRGCGGSGGGGDRYYGGGGGSSLIPEGFDCSSSPVGTTTPPGGSDRDYINAGQGGTSASSGSNGYMVIYY
jgi:hypothetical protein